MTEGYYVAFVKANREFAIEHDLKGEGAEAYAPPLVVVRRPRHLRGKEVRVTVPLYPRYLFVRQNALQKALAHRDVIGVVRFGDVRAIVPFREIRKIKGYVKTINAPKPTTPPAPIVEDHKTDHTMLNIGEEIEVMNGIFRGNTGRYLGPRRGKARIVVTASGKEFLVDLPFEHMMVRG